MQNLDHLAPDRDHQYVRMGSLCQLLQIMPGQLGVLMEDAGVKFSLVMDGIGFLSVDDAEKVAAKCRSVRQEIADVCEAAENN